MLFFILLLALGYRLVGLDWDQGQHLHPDERFLTMVAIAIKIPFSFSDYLNPQISSMSPYNNNFPFFVYGTFPLYLTKIIGVFTGNNSYNNIYIVGRFLAALFDLGVVFLVFKIGQKIANNKVGLIAAFIYSIMVLPIQLSHFFTVDTFLNFFIFLSFYLLVSFVSSKSLFGLSSLLGISFGLALGCKISALYFLPILGLGYLYVFIKALKTSRVFSVLISGFVFVFIAVFIFRLIQPTAFSSGKLLNWQLNPQFVSNLEELKSMSGANSWYPPAVQWQSTRPILFPLKNLILWGLGLPLGVLFTLALFANLINLKTKKETNSFAFGLILIWVIGLFTYQGVQFCKTMRYFLPIYPFIALLVANFLSKFNKKWLIIILLTIIVYPISFLSLYFHPVTRVTASKWIYKNVPNKSVVTFEEWDDSLPLILPDYSLANFQTQSLFMYDFDTLEKWQKLNEKLSVVDFIFLTSNRAYGSTMKLPEKYPQTTHYYQTLFNDSGNFIKVAEFTSYPCFPPFGSKPLFCFNDDSAEEAFTVYDHPKVMIFKRKE